MELPGTHPPGAGRGEGSHRRAQGIDTVVVQPSPSSNHSGRCSAPMGTALGGNPASRALEVSLQRGAQKGVQKHTPEADGHACHEEGHSAAHQAA